MKRGLGFGLMVLGLAASVGCGSSSSGGTSVSVPVSAATGGEVDVGEGKLTIPAGALAEDTTITAVSSSPSGLPDSATLTGLQYDFGPDGLSFLTPVTLELPVGSVPSGKEAVISWLDESTNTWHDETTTVTSGAVSAQISHFTTFIVRFRDGQAVDCSFSSCGGDLTGTWQIDGLCAQFPDNPFSEFCATATVEVVVDGSGTITFNSDLTYSLDVSLTGNIDAHFPASCTSGAPSCAGLLGEDFVCSGTPANGCDCTQAITDGNAETGTYATSGQTFTTTHDGSTSDPNEYCVADSVLKVRNLNDNGGTFVYTAHRQ